MVQSESAVSKIVKILLAEDNPVNQEVISEMLTSIGCQVQVVSNGQQALDTLNHESFDLILMDCQMPIMDGHEAAHHIRSLERQKGRKLIPIIGITGRSVRDNYEKGEKAFMDDLLDKPFTIDQLKDTILKWTGVHLEENIEQHEQTTISDPYQSLADSDSSSSNRLDIMALKSISKLESGSTRFLKKIVSIYFRDSAKLISEINMGIQEKNTVKISRAAHSLKSISASVGATTLSMLCAQLEDIAGREIMDDIVFRLTGIESEYAMVIDALNCFVNDVDQLPS